MGKSKIDLGDFMGFAEEMFNEAEDKSNCWDGIRDAYGTILENLKEIKYWEDRLDE